MLTASGSAPSRDWIKLVFTSRARNKIKRYFKQADKSENAEKGRDMLERELLDEGYVPKDFLTKENMTGLMQRLNFQTVDELMSSIGYGEYTPKVIANRLTEKFRHDKAEKDRKAKEAEILSKNQKVTTVSSDKHQQPQTHSEDGVVIEGVDNLLVHLAKCCMPVPGDAIVGYVTKGRGVTVHRADCPNVQSSGEMAGRLIDVRWENEEAQKQLFDT
ncbi:guanosine polyphosphate pyrophosphohydrolase/synthetase, partial [Lacticaseibacillus paracasei subsp. paracasei Lpp48]